VSHWGAQPQWLALNAFASVFKIFKYLRVSTTMNQLWQVRNPGRPIIFIMCIKGELRREGHSLHLFDFWMRASVPIQSIVLDLALLANVKSSNFKNEYGQSMHVLYNLDWDGSHRKIHLQECPSHNLSSPLLQRNDGV